MATPKRIRLWSWKLSIEEKVLLPKHFFTAAWQAPQLPTPFKVLQKVKEAQWDDNPEKLILEHMENLDIPKNILNNKELMTEMLPSIKADMLMGKKYKYVEEEPLSIPITAIWGNKDTVFDKSHLEPWSKHTSSEYEFIEIETDDQ